MYNKKNITITHVSELLKLLIFQKYRKNFFLHNIRMVKLTRKEKNTNTKRRSILRLLSVPAIYIKRKVNSIYKKLVKKTKKPDNERSYMKHFNTNVDNTNVDTNVDTYDSKIRDKISDIRVILGRLGNIVTNKDEKKIKKELYEIKKKNLSVKYRGQRKICHTHESFKTSIK